MAGRSLIPNMFHRRLVLLFMIMTSVAVLLGAQLTRLTVFEGRQLRAKAEVALERSSVLPTFRGRILDRRGRVLAVDEPGYALAVEYSVLSGRWVETAATAAARADIDAAAWRELSLAERATLTEAKRPAADATRARLWAEIAARTGLSPAEIDSRRLAIASRVKTLSLHIYEDQREREALKYGLDPKTYDYRRRPIIEEQQAHVLVGDLDDRVAFGFRALSETLPGMFEIVEDRRREYPWQRAEVTIERDTLPRPLASHVPLTVPVEGVADHILGAMRDVRAEDVKRRPFDLSAGEDRDLGGYRSLDDRAGSWGIERTFEDVLRGERGLLRRHAGTDAFERQEPIAGKDVTLTIDVVLQAQIQALLGEEIGLTSVQPYHLTVGPLPIGWRLNAAAIVLEVETGEILAMVSMPTLARGRRLAADDPLRAQIDTPVVNRPVEAVYPPGSIIKPLVLAAGITEGVHPIDEPIECTGKYFPNSLRPRCWIYRDRWNFQTHGPMYAHEALSNSCNIFFYTLADKMGVASMTEWYRRFGLGEALDVGLRRQDMNENHERVWRGEHGGYLFDERGVREATRFTRITMGIGQGEGVLWTPIQAANAFAMLARRGVARDATLVADDPRASRRPKRADCPIDPAAFRAVMEGLKGSVSVGGSGYHIVYGPGDDEVIFSAPGVSVWGKTGTAQAPPLRLHDTDGNGTIDRHDEVGISGLDHAWFVGLVGPADTDRPMFVITVVVDYGGSGGRVAGPIANQIIRVLQGEGYLPSGVFGGEAGGL